MIAPGGKKASPDGMRRDVIVSIVQGVHRILKSSHQAARLKLGRTTVAGSELWALVTLSESDCMTIGDLAARMYVHISTLSLLIDRLARAGLVKRDRCRSDRRVVYVCITPQGRKLLRAAPVPPRARLPKGLERLRTPELVHLRAAVSRLTEIMHLGQGTG